VRRLFVIAGAIPKRNCVVRVLIKEDSKILRHGNATRVDG